MSIFRRKTRLQKVMGKVASSKVASNVARQTGGMVKSPAAKTSAVALGGIATAVAASALASARRRKSAT